MANIHVDADGLLRDLKNIMEKQLPEQVKESMTQAVLFLAGESKRNLAGHVNSGELRASINGTVEDSDNGVDGFVYSSLFYAPFIEFGSGLHTDSEHVGRKDVPWKYQDAEGNWHTTEGIQYQHFMTNAIEQNRDKILEYFKEGVLKK